jgi:hypothetical protein
VSASERRKGADAEREVAGILREHGFPDAQRTADGRAQAARGDIAGIPGVHFEVKRHERLNVPAALAQVRADADPGELPVLVHRPSRAGWMATLPLADLLALLRLRETTR